jgi:hypothetical protein
MMKNAALPSVMLFSHDVIKKTPYAVMVLQTLTSLLKINNPSYKDAQRYKLINFNYA